MAKKILKELTKIGCSGFQMDRLTGEIFDMSTGITVQQPVYTKDGSTCTWHHSTIWNNTFRESIYDIPDECKKDLGQHGLSNYIICDDGSLYSKSGCWWISQKVVMVMDSKGVRHPFKKVELTFDNGNKAEIFVHRLMCEVWHANNNTDGKFKFVWFEDNSTLNVKFWNLFWTNDPIADLNRKPTPPLSKPSKPQKGKSMVKTKITKMKATTMSDKYINTSIELPNISGKMDYATISFSSNTENYVIAKLPTGTDFEDKVLTQVVECSILKKDLKKHSLNPNTWILKRSIFEIARDSNQFELNSIRTCDKSDYVPTNIIAKVKDLYTKDGITSSDISIQTGVPLNIVEHHTKNLTMGKVKQSVTGIVQQIKDMHAKGVPVGTIAKNTNRSLVYILQVLK